MADGSIVFDVEMKVGQAERELAKLNNDIKNLEASTAEMEMKKTPLLEQAEKIAAKIREAKAEVEKYKAAWLSGEVGADKQEMDAVEKVAELQKEYEGVSAQIDKIDARLAPAYEKLDGMVQEAAELNIKMANSAESTEQESVAVDKLRDRWDGAKSAVDAFGHRIGGLVKRVFVFSVITAALRAFRTYMTKVIKTNSEASAAIARLKGAFLTLIQPIISAVIPALIWLINVITSVISAVASLFAALTGSSLGANKKAAAALQKQTDGYGAAGGAAADAAEQVEEYKDATLGIDELNIVSPPEQKDTGAGGGGGGAGGGSIAPDFDFDEKKGNKLVDLLLLIAAAAGFAALKFGLLGAGIALVAGGIALLVDGFNDAFENGFNDENLQEIIAGILLIGAGLSLITGTILPLLLAGLAALLLFATVATGHGEELLEGLKEALEGFKEFFVGIFTGDMDMATQGIVKIFEGLGKAIWAILQGVRDTFLQALDYIDQLTGGKLTGIINTIKQMVRGLFEAIKQILSGVIDFLVGIFTGDWERAFKGLLNIVFGIANGIITVIEGAINFVIDGFNLLLSVAGEIINKVSSLFGGPSVNLHINHVTLARIPALAQGAVIPPNREFLAVLGDQKSGTNIEAPLETIKQAVAEVLGDRDDGGENVPIDVTLLLDGEVLYRNQQMVARKKGVRINKNPAFSN